jgi:hypothetical protein
LSRWGSCKKFLTETPYSLLSTNNFYQSAGDAEVALNGVFATLTAQTYYGRTSWTVTELGGEDLTVPSTSSSDRITLGNYTETSSNGEVANWWNNIYSMVNRANDVIANVPKISMDIPTAGIILSVMHAFCGRWGISSWSGALGRCLC